MENSTISLFCWLLPASLPPGVVMWPLEVFLSNMAATEERLITFEETEILSFFRQNIIQKICEVAAALNLPKTHPLVCQTVSKYLNLGPAPHQLFDNLVWRLACMIWGEWFHVTPHMSNESFPSSKQQIHEVVFSHQDEMNFKTPKANKFIWKLYHTDVSIGTDLVSVWTLSMLQWDTRNGPTATSGPIYGRWPSGSAWHTSIGSHTGCKWTWPPFTIPARWVGEGVLYPGHSPLCRKEKGCRVTEKPEIGPQAFMSCLSTCGLLR